LKSVEIGDRPFPSERFNLFFGGNTRIARAPAEGAGDATVVAANLIERERKVPLRTNVIVLERKLEGLPRKLWPP
jgi:hypothetical protein